MRLQRTEHQIVAALITAELCPVLITTRRDQRDRADVVTAIRVIVNARMQSRRDADEKCPGKRCKQNGRNKCTRASL